jgi:hypothetical protein
VPKIPRSGAPALHRRTPTAGFPAAFEALCKQAAATDWVVHVKPSFGDPQRVLKYLTHRVAISNSRLRHRLWLASSWDRDVVDFICHPTFSMTARVSDSFSLIIGKRPC